MTTSLLNNPCTGPHEIYNFSRPYISHHYYILSLCDLCLGVEKKIFKRKGKSCRNQVLILIIIDQCKEWKTKLIINFTDFDNERKSYKLKYSRLQHCFRMLHIMHTTIIILVKFLSLKRAEIREKKLNQNFLWICASTHYILHNYKFSRSSVKRFQRR